MLCIYCRKDDVVMGVHQIGCPNTGHEARANKVVGLLLLSLPASIILALIIIGLIVLFGGE